MITLYHCANARSFRVLWMLEELGLRYELKMLPFPPRVFAREYLKVNPLGGVPFFIDGDVRMTESAAICQYLAAISASTALNVERDEPGYAAFLNGLHFGEGCLTFPQTLVLRYNVLEPEDRRIPQAADDYAVFFFRNLRAVDSLLQEQEFVAAGRFTAADISIGYSLLLAKVVGHDDRFPPAVQAYWKRISSRAGFARAVAQQEAAAVQQGIEQPPMAGAGTGMRR
ncbi:MAG: glutathione S-transferase [Ramlibacter sp.]|nr:glutathione S-transferase [Ramlibacter sp.]